MRIALVVFLVLILVYIVLALPFPIKFKCHVNGIKLLSFYSIKFWFFKVLCGKAYIEDNKFIMQNTHNHIYSNDKNAIKQQVFLKSIIKRISVHRAELYFTGGMQDDAYVSAMLCGYVQVISSALISVIITKNPFVNIFQDIDPTFNKDNLDFSAKILLEISILDILIAKHNANRRFKEQYGKK